MIKMQNLKSLSHFFLLTLASKRISVKTHSIKSRFVWHRTWTGKYTDVCRHACALFRWGQGLKVTSHCTLMADSKLKPKPNLKLNSWPPSDRYKINFSQSVPASNSSFNKLVACTGTIVNKARTYSLLEKWSVQFKEQVWAWFCCLIPLV